MSALSPSLLVTLESAGELRCFKQGVEEIASLPNEIFQTP